MNESPHEKTFFGQPRGLATLFFTEMWERFRGGWLADRFLGQRRAVLWGGIVIAAGHFSMAVPTVASFYLGLLLIVIGTGLLKPNISTIVGQLYAADDERRDAGFSIFYMGINIGAFVAPNPLRLPGRAGRLAPRLQPRRFRHGAGPRAVRPGRQVPR